MKYDIIMTVKDTKDKINEKEVNQGLKMSAGLSQEI
jgi:hypothetical protein